MAASRLLTANKDILYEILDWLDIKTFVRVARTASGATTKCAQYIAARRPCYDDIDFYARLRAEFVCPCGRIGWNIQRGCLCWVKCLICLRELPRVLTTPPPPYRCKYGCVCYPCPFCQKKIYLTECVRNGETSLYKGRPTCTKCTQRNLLDHNIIPGSRVKDHFAWRLILVMSIWWDEGPGLKNLDPYIVTEDEKYRWTLLAILRKCDPYNPLIELLK